MQATMQLHLMFLHREKVNNSKPRLFILAQQKYLDSAVVKLILL